jgi:hypothetical protein
MRVPFVPAGVVEGVRAARVPFGPTWGVAGVPARTGSFMGGGGPAVQALSVPVGPAVPAGPAVPVL